METSCICRAPLAMRSRADTKLVYNLNLYERCLDCKGADVQRRGFRGNGDNPCLIGLRPNGSGVGARRKTRTPKIIVRLLIAFTAPTGVSDEEPSAARRWARSWVRRDPAAGAGVVQEKWLGN